MKKRKMLMALSLAFVATIASCAGSNENAPKTNQTTNPVVVSTNTPTNNSTNNVEENCPVKAFVIDEGITPTICATYVKDNKLANIFFMSQSGEFVMQLDIKNEKIVGVFLEKIDPSPSPIYLPVGENFVNNIDNLYLFSVENNELVIKNNNFKLNISSDGNVTSKEMKEIIKDKETETTLSKISISDNSVNIKLEILSQDYVLTFDDDDFSLKTYDNTNNILYQNLDVIKDNNVTTYNLYSHDNKSPFTLKSSARIIYNNDNKPLKYSKYSFSNGGITEDEEGKYYYDNNGLLNRYSSNYMNEYFEYDQYGRISKDTKESDVTEYEYNEKGLYSNVIQLSQYSIEPSGRYEYVYNGNDEVEKINIYMYDFNNKVYAESIGAVITETENNGIITRTTLFEDGFKVVNEEEITPIKNYSSREKFDSAGNSIDYSAYEMTFASFGRVYYTNYDMYNGVKYKSYTTYEEKTDYGYDAYTLYLDSNNQIQKGGKDATYINADGRIDKILRYSYDTTKKEYITEPQLTTTIIRDNDGNVTFVEQLGYYYKETTEYIYTEGVLTKVISIEASLNSTSGEFLPNNSTEIILTNGNITECKSYEYNDGKKTLSYQRAYDNLHREISNRYYSYSQGEINKYSYGEDREYNDFDNYAKIIYVSYNVTTNSFETSIEENYEYNEDNLEIKATAVYNNKNIEVTLQNEYDENGNIAIQYKVVKEGNDITKDAKFVIDYENRTTTEYSKDGNEWVLKQTIHFIYYQTTNYQNALN